MYNQIKNKKIIMHLRENKFDEEEVLYNCTLFEQSFGEKRAELTAFRIW